MTNQYCCVATIQADQFVFWREISRQPCLSKAWWYALKYQLIIDSVRVSSPVWRQTISSINAGSSYIQPPETNLHENTIQNLISYLQANVFVNGICKLPAIWRRDDCLTETQHAVYDSHYRAP